MDTKTMRLDKWLWVARFFKTRAQAAEAVDGGKVHVNAARVKPAREIRPGDRLRIRLGPFEHQIVVTGLAPRRGPAAAARALYEETEESLAARTRLREQLALLPAAFIPAQERPTKKHRRELNRFRGRG